MSESSTFTGEQVDRLAAGTQSAAAAHAPALERIAVVGMSVSPTCGVLAHAGLLAQELSRQGLCCTEHWLMLGGGSLREELVQVRAWTRALAAELADSRAEVVLLHYSIFAHSHRGLPLFVHPMLSALSATGIPIVILMHEFAYPWGLGGWRGSAWALSHRALLVQVMSRASAVVVTTDFRADWLYSRRWLARRPLGIAPVFSNLPTPDRGSSPEGDPPTVGLFGYSYDERAISLVLDSVRLLVERGVHFQLTLLGAPGRASALAQRWLSAAAARNVAQVLSFAGPLAPQQLSDALAGCEVLLFADSAGPSSRKGTLAGSLASGRPLVAVDGPRTWSELARVQAARIVFPMPHAVADVLAELLCDEQARTALGARGCAFAEQHMGVARSAQVVRGLLGAAVRV